MTPRTFHHQQGIAIGPILFIIAILAIIAAAIAAGSGAFNANTNTESTKQQAATILMQLQAIKDGTQRAMLENGCDVTQLDFSSLTTATNPNAPSDGSCAIFKPTGGSISSIPVVPPSATTTGTDTFQVVDSGTNCSGLSNFGTPTNQQLFIRIRNVTSSVCAAFDTLVGRTGWQGSNWDGYFASFNFTGTFNDNIGSCGSDQSPSFPICLKYGAGTLSSIYDILVMR
jgi:type II secretory pathway pseudopilin PulG